jgi:hypothetical protein
MYDEELTRIPKDAGDLWAVLTDQFELALMVFRDAAIEEKEDAFDDERRRQNLTLREVGALIPFRGTSEEWDNRNYFIEMGQSLIPEIECAIEARDFSPQFVQRWGMFMFCHGFIASYVLDDSDPLANKRGGVKRGKQRSKEQQRKWLAHVLLKFMSNGATRGEAEQKAVELVRERIFRAELRGGFHEKWFSSILTFNELAATYDEKHFSRKSMKELILLPTNDIPPLP